MNVILTEEVPNLGQIGEQVKVAGGYARNYLIPKGLAVEATTRSVKEMEHKRRQIEAKAARFRQGAEEEKVRLEKVSITFPVLVGEDDRLYGSVTTRDIHASLEEKGISVDRRKITLPEPIRRLGVFSIEVKLYRDVVATIKVWVVKKEEEATETETEEK